MIVLKICVVGLGNIGLQLLMDLNRRKIPAAGVDVKLEVVESLRLEGYQVDTDIRDFQDTDAWLVAISTGAKMESLFELIEHLHPKPGALISIESTLIPGTMQRLAEVFEKQQYQIGHDLFFVHVPHRINFGMDRDVFEQPRVIGGITEACLNRGCQFYQPLIKKMIPLHDVRLAELAKVIENSIRHLNIAFAETIYQYCIAQELDFQELRKAVNSKSNVTLLDVDYGIGGECLTKDMQFLEDLTETPLMRSALQADHEYREFLFQMLKNESGVLISGVTYKPELKNTGFSRAIELYWKLADHGTPVYAEDPYLTGTELQQLGLRPWNNEPVSVIIKRGKIFPHFSGVLI